MMLHTKYQGSMSFGFIQPETRRFFSCLPYKAYVKHVTPGRARFWLKGHYLSKIGRGPLDDATYQISRL